MNNKMVLAIDQGTTGTTAVLIDAESFQLIEKENIEFKQIYPKPGLVEHDLDDIWYSIKKPVTSVLKKSARNADDIISIGITNQRETTCAFNNLGKPISNAIVWQDRRTSELCNDKQDGYQALKKKTGLPLDPYFSATKMSWLLDNDPAVSSAAKNNKLKFGTIDTYLVYRLTGGNSFVTEPTNASRTLLMDINTCQWDKELLDFFSIDQSFLPEIKDTFSQFGITNGLDFLPDGIPISCILGDQQAALFGQACFNKGDIKITYGTGSFLLMNIGDKPIYSSNGLLTTVAYKHKGQTIYALEGAVYIAGAAVQWLRDNLGIIKKASEVETLAKDALKDINSLEHLIFLPFFTGMASPHWKADAKAAIVGMTRDTGNEQIAFACLEGVALSLSDLAKAAADDSKLEIESIKVDGGAAANDLLLQLQSNVLETQVIRPEVIETTAFGAGVGSLIGNDKISFSQISDKWRQDKTFSADPTTKEYTKKKIKLWNNYIQKLYL